MKTSSAARAFCAADRNLGQNTSSGAKPLGEQRFAAAVVGGGLGGAACGCWAGLAGGPQSRLAAGLAAAAEAGVHPATPAANPPSPPASPASP
eukprot:7380658-Prymnesium_polylepis.1